MKPTIIGSLSLSLSVLKIACKATLGILSPKTTTVATAVAAIALMALVDLESGETLFCRRQRIQWTRFYLVAVISVKALQQSINQNAKQMATS